MLLWYRLFSEARHKNILGILGKSFILVLLKSYYKILINTYTFPVPQCEINHIALRIHST